MKLALPDNKHSFQDIESLISEDLIREVSILLDIDDKRNIELRTAIRHAYYELIDGYYTVQKAAPEHIESDALMRVYNDTYNLIDSLNNLLSIGNSNQRLAETLKSPQCLSDQQADLWDSLIGNRGQENLNLRILLSDLAAASMKAADLADNEHEKLTTQLHEQQGPEKIEFIENQLNLHNFVDKLYPQKNEDRKQRIAERKIPKHLPIKNAVSTLKAFIEEHSLKPFTAGKYYPESGYTAPAVLAIKTILKNIAPQTSDRKIASLIQELPSS